MMTSKKNIEKTGYFPVNDLDKVNLWFLLKRWKANKVFLGLSDEEVESLLVWHSLAGHVKPFLVADNDEEIPVIISRFVDEIHDSNRCFSERNAVVKMLNKKVTETKQGVSFTTNILEARPEEVYFSDVDRLAIESANFEIKGKLGKRVKRCNEFINDYDGPVPGNMRREDVARKLYEYDQDVFPERILESKGRINPLYGAVFKEAGLEFTKKNHTKRRK